MKQGFSLIELMVALTISSGVALMLFQVYNQSLRILGRVDGIVSTDIRVMTFYDRFEKDVTGAFIPLIGDLDLAKKMLEKHEGDVRTQQLKQQEQEGEGGESKEKSAQKPQKVKPVTLADIQVKRSFVCSQKDGKLAELSFITNNPLEVYAESPSVKPRIARVSYSIEQDKEKKGLFKLVRRESKKLKLAEIKKERPYALLNNIKSLKVELLATEPVKEPEEEEKTEKDKDPKDVKKEADKKEGDPKKEEKKEEEKPKPLKTYTEWPASDEKEVQSKDDKKKPSPRDLPQFVKVFLTYEDPIEEREKAYEFMIPVFSFAAPSKEVLSVPLLVQERLKKEEEEVGPTKTKDAAQKKGEKAQPKGAQK